VQRLFSTFADGWPGAGLLLLRLVTGAVLIGSGISDMRDLAPPLTIALQTICIAAAILLLGGAFTPLAGALAAGLKVGMALSRFLSDSVDPWMSLAQAALAAALAMIGPGAWSVDARRFGRKHIDLSEH
jgi:putative oxidoreductase